MATQPLLVSNDPVLVDDVLRLASANGVDLHVAPDAESARARWSTSPLVLVGSDLADAVAGTRPIRRGDVILVTRSSSEQDWRSAVAMGAEHVAALPDAERWLIDRLADGAEGESRNGIVLAIAGAGSGSGASTFAVTAALAGAARGLRTLLVDADPSSGGIDLLLGLEGEPGTRWPDLQNARGRIRAAELAGSLPSTQGVAVLSAGRMSADAPTADVVSTVLDAGERGFDLVVADVGRALHAASFAVVARSRQVLLVTSNHVASVAAAARLSRLLEPSAAAVGVVVRLDGSGVSDEAIRSVLPLGILGRLPRSVGLAGRADDGDPPSLRDAYGRACANVLDDLLAFIRPIGRSA
jgi:secretion/DNA translocation related CpaE-like protein